jgi:hypothetical protein
MISGLMRELLLTQARMLLVVLSQNDWPLSRFRGDALSEIRVRL